MIIYLLFCAGNYHEGSTSLDRMRDIGERFLDVFDWRYEIYKVDLKIGNVILECKKESGDEADNS